MMARDVLSTSRPGRPRASLRAAFTALAVALLGSVVTAAPAAADTNTYADAVGEQGTSASTDITAYRVQLTDEQLTVTVTMGRSPTASGTFPTGRAMVIDLSDGFLRYRAEQEGDTWWVHDPWHGDQYVSCVRYAWRDNTTTTLVLPHECFSASQVSVRISVRDGDGSSDVAPASGLSEWSVPVYRGPDVGPSAAPEAAVYRFWSPTFANAHFFTTDEGEAERILGADRNWLFEGAAFSAVVADGGTCQEGEAVHRFYSARFQSHFFTQDQAEKDAIIARDRNWTYEGVAYCAFPDAVAGTVPLYRFWSPVFGKHFFTADQEEADHLRAVDRNWTYEGIAYHVLP